MPLEPGTPGIAGVRPFRAPHATGTETWSCSTCGRDHPVVTSRLLTFRHHDGTSFDFVVCSPCAEERAPHHPSYDEPRIIDLPDLERPAL